MTFFDRRESNNSKLARNIQLVTIVVIMISLICSRLFTGIITSENAFLFIISDGIITFLMMWYAIYVVRNF